MGEFAAQEGGDKKAGSPAGNFPTPSLSLPKGGGAIRGIGEKFSVSAVTGTAAFSIPIFTSPNRSSFTPALALSYDSGSGTGIFGMGWNLSSTSISRKTEKKLPQYLDNPNGQDSDTFLLAGSEDLVPVSGGVSQRTIQGEGIYTICRYRPRIEGLFSRIEKWTHVSTGDIHWKTTTRDNSLSIFGKTPSARIADPEDPKRIFKWLLEETRDSRGNIARYEYKAENLEGVDSSRIEEKTRLTGQFTNRYLKRVLYGNRKPYEANDWFFELVLDYGDHHPDLPTPNEDRAWVCRQDPFSSYKSGFDIRCYRLCRRSLMFHHFQELGETPCLVRSMEFEYEEDGIFSFLISAKTTSWRRQTGTSDYFRKPMPKVEFSYSKPEIDTTVRTLDPKSFENVPAGVDEEKYLWEDLDKEGLVGVLCEEKGAWFYKRNLGNAKFGAAELIAEKPTVLIASGARLADTAGNSGQYLVQKSKALRGFWKRDEEAAWESFTPFENNVLEADSLKEKLLIDLNGDGLAEVLLDEDNVYSWYPSLGEKGYGRKESIAKSEDASRRPALVYSGKSESILTADMSGDGLQDIVRIRNGEISYWPNLGWGRFGSRITMSDSPFFDHPDQFDPKRIRLADIDGSGVTDIFYLGRSEISYWFNRSGNGWSGKNTLKTFPNVDRLNTISTVDLLGNGTSCLVCSSPIPNSSVQPLRYIDLMSGKKPHLLVHMKNNMGAETVIHYAPSTQFYLEDRIAGRPWVTKLPFPVQVVAKTESLDKIGGSRFITRYAYHHGYYDREEKEFRGFGMTEQWDTEEFSVLAAEGIEATNVDEASHMPPVLTRTWYHTGAYFDGEKISKQYEHEYFADDLGGKFLPDTILPAILDVEEEREACRALKNAVLRQEVYALDRGEKSSLPYSVSERNYTVKLLQPKGKNRHAVFYTHARETLDYYYERTRYELGGQALFDPRVSHAMTLEVDDFGNNLLTVAIAYGRRLNLPDPMLAIEDRLEQQKIRITASENRFTNTVETFEAYRTPLPSEARTYELLGLIPEAAEPNVTNLFTLEEMAAKFVLASDGAHEIPYEDVEGSSSTPGVPSRRRIEDARTLYRSDDMTGALALGVVEPLALPFESYKLAFTPGLLSSAYEGRVTEAILGEGGYVQLNGEESWWTPSGKVFYSPLASDTPAQELAFAKEHFFQNYRFVDPFGNTTKARYDDYDLLLLEIEDPLQNKMTAGERIGDSIENKLDYRVLIPTFLTDANGNRSAVSMDTWGFVAGIAAMGKMGENQGDSLEGFEPDLDDATLANYFQNPLANSALLLQKATTRIVSDVFAYARTQSDPQPQPCVGSTITRETHESELGPGETSRLYHTFNYCDGFGREVQVKGQSEPGPVQEGGEVVEVRWVGASWTIFNNKGLAVKKYEPYFSATHLFEFGKTIGVSTTLFYDPMGRTLATLHPNHTYDKVFFDPWRQERWDVNDTVLLDPQDDAHVGDFFRRIADEEYLPTWHSLRNSGVLGPEEKSAADKAAAHAATPTTAYSDSLGRAFFTVADNGVLGKEKTKLLHDIENNQRKAMDALGRVVMRYDYDILGGRLRQESMEAGKRWMFSDIAAKPIYSWDERGHQMRSQYDALQRPLRTFLSKNNEPEKMIHQMVYGGDAATNHRGRILESFDSAGKLTHHSYDFKGNLLSSSRQFALEYKELLDWSGSVALNAEIFTDATRYDALNRPIEMQSSDSSVYFPSYNESRKLNSIVVQLRGATQGTNFLDNVDHNAKGQRTRIDYGNGVTTSFEFDPLSDRLTRLRTTRGNTVLQDYRYVYDPAGNITSIQDAAQPTIYFNGAVVEANSEYTYDAQYRLLTATGREHQGQQSSPETTWNDAFRTRLPHPNDGQAMRRYTEQYEYDSVGNILQLIHQTNNEKWTRQYVYDEASLLEPTKNNNRLTSSVIGHDDVLGLNENYSYDEHGNITTMPHLSLLTWDFKDQLRSSAQQVVGAGMSAETTYYVYDANGKRVRKVTERANGTRKEERLYTGAVERFRKFDGSGNEAELERETLQIMDNTRRIALVETKTIDEDSPGGLPETAIRYQHDNHLGSAALELDEEGSVISYEEYFPYGGSSYQAGRSEAEVSLKRYRYSGKERDEETGFYYYGARYYPPWLARWINCDPGGLVDGHNLYLFVQANPIRLQDPNGFQCNEINACPPPPPPILQKEAGVGEDGFPVIEVSEVQIVVQVPKKPSPPISGGYKVESIWDVPAYWMLYEINTKPGTSSRNFVTDESLKTGQDGCIGLSILALTVATGGMAGEVAAGYGWGVVATDAFVGATSSSVGFGLTNLYEGRDPSPQEAATVITTGAAGGVVMGKVMRALPGVANKLVDGAKKIFAGEVAAEESTGAQVVAKKLYNTKPMRDKYVTEDQPGNQVWPGREVKYLRGAEREALKVTIKDGKMYDANGNLFDTSASSTLGQGKAIFVMDAKGNIYISNYQKVGQFHHSSLLAGQPVAAAGEIEVKNGVVKVVNDRSGHYMPEFENTMQFLKELKDRGINTSTINLTEMVSQPPRVQ